MNPTYQVAKAIGFGMMYGTLAKRFAMPKTVWFKPGDRVLVRSLSKRPSRQARSPRLGTVTHEAGTSMVFVLFDGEKKSTAAPHYLVSSATIVDEVGRM